MSKYSVFISAKRIIKLASMFYLLSRRFIKKQVLSDTEISVQYLAYKNHSTSFTRR